MELLQQGHQSIPFRFKTQEKNNASSAVIYSGLSAVFVTSIYDFGYGDAVIFSRPINTKISISYTNPEEVLYKEKEKEWHELVGEKEFQSLDRELRDFLINAAGMFDLGFPINIKKAYRYFIFENED